MGFILPLDDPDFTRVMNFVWNLLDLRGELDKCAEKWLK
jgi:cyclohexadienyl dehydratase